MKKTGLVFVTVPLIVGMALAGWAATFTVTATSENDCSDLNCNLQSALNAAAANNEDDTISIGDGTFNGPFTYVTTKNFSLTLIGSGSTVIDGKKASQGMLLSTSDSDGTNAHMILRNISFQNGNSQSYAGGGGLHVSTNKSNITIEKCTLSNNTGQDGGGAYIESVSGMITVRGNVFQGNSAVNLSGGGAEVASTSGNVTLDDNLFIDNDSHFHGGGVNAISAAGNVTLLNNIFIANSANVFGGGVSLADMSLESGAPGVITAVNNTFVGNSAASIGGGLSITLDNTTSKASLYNNILWSNTSKYYGQDVIICDDCSGAAAAGEVNLYNNDFFNFYSTCPNDAGCTPKTNQGNNKNQNPLFVNITDSDPYHWDVHLTSSSPCIDGGNGNAPNLPGTDFHGDARTFGPAPDMGAFESPYKYSPVTPKEGTLGSEITITGSGFGKTKGKVLVGSVAPKILGWTDSSIRCQLSKTPPLGIYDVTIQPKGASPIVVGNGFTVMPPAISLTEPTHGAAGGNVTIHGSFFGTKTGKVTLGGKTCKVLSWTMVATTGESQIQFTIPKGLTSGAKDLTVTNGLGAKTTSFTVD